MKSMVAKAGWVGIAVAVLVPALALGAHATGGTFTSTQADVHVARGGGKIVNADINCKLQGGVTIEAMAFQRSIKIKAAGSFSYHGTAFYSKAPSHRSKMTTASISGKFVTAQQVKGKVRGGPGACRSVTFAAKYNPRAH